MSITDAIVPFVFVMGLAFIVAVLFFRDVMAKPLSRAIPKYKINNESAYESAHEFKNTYSPAEGTNYEWVVEYAKLNYEQLHKASETLDGKAESIIRTLGGGTGLLTLGAIINLQKLNTYVSVCLALALLAALAAIFVAALVRLPRQTFMPPSIAWALEYADHYGANAENKFIAQWHLACEGTRLTVREKSKGVTTSTVLASIAFVLVGVAFVTAVGTIQTDTARPKSKSADMADTTTTPDPAVSPQTPVPVSSGQPNGSPASTDPAVSAEPQSIQAGSDDGERQDATKANQP